MRRKEFMVREGLCRTERYIVMFLFSFLSFVYISLFGQWMALNSRDKVFTEYLNGVLQTAALEKRPAKEVRALLLVKAEDLSLPISDDSIRISGQGQTLKAAVRYKADINMPIVNQPVHRLRFYHQLEPHF
jgi:hypothetical protein